MLKIKVLILKARLFRNRGTYEAARALLIILNDYIETINFSYEEEKDILTESKYEHACLADIDGFLDESLDLHNEVLDTRKEQCRNTLALLIRALEPSGVIGIQEDGNDLHENIAASLTAVGIILTKKGNFASARSSLQQALEIRQKLYSEWSCVSSSRAKENMPLSLSTLTHSGIAESYCAIGQLLTQQGFSVSARRFIETSILMRCEIFSIANDANLEERFELDHERSKKVKYVDVRNVQCEVSTTKKQSSSSFSSLQQPYCTFVLDSIFALAENSRLERRDRFSQSLHLLVLRLRSNTLTYKHVNYLASLLACCRHYSYTSLSMNEPDSVELRRIYQLLKVDRAEFSDVDENISDMFVCGLGLAQTRILLDSVCVRFSQLLRSDHPIVLEANAEFARFMGLHCGNYTEALDTLAYLKLQFLNCGLDASLLSMQCNVLVAQIKRLQGNYAESLRTYEAAVKELKQRVGVEHVYTVEAVLGQAQCSLDYGQFEAVRGALVNLQSIIDVASGLEPPTSATSTTAETATLSPAGTQKYEAVPLPWKTIIRADIFRTQGALLLCKKDVKRAMEKFKAALHDIQEVLMHNNDPALANLTECFTLSAQTKDEIAHMRTGCSYENKIKDFKRRARISASRSASITHVRSADVLGTDGPTVEAEKVLSTTAASLATRVQELFKKAQEGGAALDKLFMLFDRSGDNKVV